MKHEQTIAMAQTLLAEGRAADVVRMIVPLLGGTDEPDTAILLHGLLARARLGAGDAPDGVLGGALGRFASEAARAALPPRLHAEVALWLGWAHTFPGAHRDLPRALHLLRQADVRFAQRLDVRGRLWALVGQVRALDALGEPGLAAALAQAAPIQHALRDEQAAMWLRQLGWEEEPGPFVLPSVAADVRRLAVTRCPVLLRGAAGTGKEHLARRLHAARAARGRPGAEALFVALGTADPSDPCYAEPMALAEGGLQKTLTALPPGSTLFIDEAGRLPEQAQADLLHFLTRAEERATEPPVHVIAATRYDLGERTGDFNEALLHRLTVATAELLPLRERPFEVALLAHHFTRELRVAGAPVASLTDPAMQALLSYAWPGNIRQMRNEIERALVFAGSEPVPVINLGDLSGAIAAAFSGSTAGQAAAPPRATPEQSLDEALAEMEKAIIEQTLATHGGQVTASAAALGLTRQGLYKKMKRLGIDASQFQPVSTSEPAAPLLHLN